MTYPDTVPIKRAERNHQQIVDNINKSRAIRDAQRDQIKDLKIQYLQDHKEELKHKRMERMIEQFWQMTENGRHSLSTGS